MWLLLYKTKSGKDDKSHRLDHKHGIGAKFKGQKFHQEKQDAAGSFAWEEQKAQITCDGEHCRGGSELNAGDHVKGDGI